MGGMALARLLLPLAVCACTGSHTAVDHHEARPAPRPDEAVAGRSAVDLPGDANGIYWDAAKRTLYVTDDTHDQIAAWTDAGGFRAIGSLPAAPKVGLGGLVELSDGRFVTTSFGFGTEGGVFTLADGKPAVVSGLDPARRRIGLAVDRDGVLYDAYFVVHPGSKHAGGIARLDLAGHETDLALPDLVKPVGVAVDATTLYISDQERATITAYVLATGAQSTFAKDLPSVDLLTLLPGGDLITGGKRGEVYRIGRDGKVATIAKGFEQVRGTAYDATGGRLFVVEHSAATSRHRLHILPLDR